MHGRDFLKSVGDTAAAVVASNLRFHLAEDRVREFLIGESLYGDPSLAVRELYQNAVDACRLAVARRQYLAQPTKALSPGDDDIEVRQGVSDGRRYIDCIDRGAGMSLTELTEAFSQAGMRASDLAERQVEVHDFAAAQPPVEFRPNSRFGIGVLSYFLLADALTVTTARLERDGSIGEVLEMHISDSAASFDVLSRGPAAESGSRIRLWLKKSLSVSAVGTLRNLVLVCPFRLHVIEERGLEHRWEPGELNSGSDHVSAALTAVRADENLWWTESDGAVLADGIWAGREQFGMVVNLTGADAPQLTADRRRITHLDRDGIAAKANDVAARGVETAWHVIGRPEWLSDVCRTLPEVADTIVTRAMRHGGLTLRLHGVDLPISRSGYAPGDDTISWDDSAPGVISWRFARQRAAGLYASLGVPPDPTDSPEPALPSDGVLLGSCGFVFVDGTMFQTRSWSPGAASIYEAERLLGYPLDRIIRRAETLGLPLPAAAHLLPASTDAVRFILALGRRLGALKQFRPVCAFDVLRTSWALDVPVGSILEELAAREIELSPDALSVADYRPSAGILVAASERYTGSAPWFDPRTRLGIDLVVAAARATSDTPHEIVAGLAFLGFDQLPDLELAGMTISDDDLLMLSCDLDREYPFLGRSRPASSTHIRKAATLLSFPEHSVRARLAAFGVTEDDTPWRDETRSLRKREVFALLGMPAADRRSLTRRQLRLMSRDADGQAPWLDPRRPVPAWLTAMHALRGRGVQGVMEEYRRLGFAVEDPRATTGTRVPGTVGRAH